MRIFDGHCDTILKMECGEPLDFSFEAAEKNKGFIQSFAYFCEEASINPCINSLKNFTSFFINNTGGHILYTRHQFKNALNTGVFGAFLTLENSLCLEEDIYNLLYLYNLGVRAITLTWNYENSFAGGALCPKGGLTKRGRDLILLAEKLGILIDLSHLNRQSFFDVISFGHGKLYCSHSSCDALCPHPRNLTDEQIVSLYDAGGVVCVCPNPAFITGGSSASLQDYARHLRHVLNLTDGRGAAIGTDTDGITHTLQRLKTTEDLLELPCELASLGFSDYEIQNIFFCNFKSFL